MSCPLLQPSGKHFRLLLGLSRARPQEPKKLGNAKTRSPPTQANHDMSRICENKDSANRGDPNNRWPRSARLTKVGRRCRACGAFRRPPLAVRRACLRSFSLALAWPKSARIGFYGLRQCRRPPVFFCMLASKIVLKLLLFLMSFSSGLFGHFSCQNQGQNRAKIKAKSFPRRSWSRVAAGSHFGLHVGPCLDLWNP